MPVAAPGPRHLRQVALAVSDNATWPIVADQVFSAAVGHLPLPLRCANLAITRKNFIMLATGTITYLSALDLGGSFLAFCEPRLA